MSQKFIAVKLVKIGEIAHGVDYKKDFQLSTGSLLNQRIKAWHQPEPLLGHSTKDFHRPLRR